MLPSKGEITAPWGVPTFVSFHSPSSDTPAFNHFWIRRITRRHHPFEGQSLEVLRHAHMRGSLQFVLILPDGSKSLIPAEWTDFNATTCPAPSFQLAGSLEDLLDLRSLVDALLRRAADVPVTSGRDQESH